jgi:hypothetical protein
MNRFTSIQFKIAFVRRTRRLLEVYMHAGLQRKLSVRLVGVLAAFPIVGCSSVPDCETDETAVQEAVVDGDTPDLALCKSNPDICIPSKNSLSVADYCGVFVSFSRGTEVADGTKLSPARTIKQASEILTLRLKDTGGLNASIYLCTESFTEEVSLPSGISLYGGLDCADPVDPWVHKLSGSGKVTVLTAGEGKVPLRLDRGTTTQTTLPSRIEDIRVAAKRGTNMNTASEVSSIAVIANEATAIFTRCKLEADNGAQGNTGAAHEENKEKGIDGVDGVDACIADTMNQTKGPIKTCEVGESEGGFGGSGGETFGNPGGKGDPDSPSAPPNGGAGEGAGMAGCGNGGNGSSGTEGAPGADAMGLGKLDAIAGYVGVTSDGQSGTPGRGGGGGGGSKSSSLCQMMNLGASGGSGGTGGCGGRGGRGGGYGGSSIGVVSIASTLELKSTTVIVKNAGAPGLGGEGQPGAAGGKGGKGGGSIIIDLKPACAGGSGGTGGKGGHGGKGTRGHVIGVAYTGELPKRDGDSKVEFRGETGANPEQVEEQKFLQ